MQKQQIENRITYYEKVIGAAAAGCFISTSAQRRVLCRYYAAAGKIKNRDVRKRASYIPLRYILMSN